jgi:chorismate mutase
MNHDLDDLRRSLDNIDNAIIYLLAERFSLTRKVGEYKRDHKLPPVDLNREEQQFARIKKLATEAKLNEEVATKYLRLIIDEVVKEHTKLQAE